MPNKARRERYKKSQERRRKIAAGMDHHHILFTRHKWNSTASTRELRQYFYCVIPLRKATLHRFIHDNVPEIPVPSEEAAREVLEQLRALEFYRAISKGDSIRKRLQLLISLFDYYEKSTADALRAQLKAVDKFYNNPP